MVIIKVDKAYKTPLWVSENVGNPRFLAIASKISKIVFNQRWETKQAENSDEVDNENQTVIVSTKF